MADGVDIATLGLRVDNAQGVAALNQFGDASERTAARSTAASNKIIADTQRNAQAVKQYAMITDSEMSRATEWFDKMYGSTGKVASGLDNVATSTTRSIGGLGRLSYSFGALDARMLGTSSIVGRMGAVFGNLFAGGPWTIALLAGFAAISAAFSYMSNQSADAAKEIATLRDEVEKAGNAMGTMSTKAVDAETNTIKALLGGAGGIKAFFSSENMSALWNATKGLATGGVAGALSGYGASLVGQLGQTTADAKQNDEDARKKAVNNYASMMRDGDTSAALRAKEMEQLRLDTREMATLKGKWDDASVQRQVELGQQMKTANDALYPKEKKAKKPSFLDPITTGSVAIKDSVEQSITWYKREVEEADRAIAARAKFLGTQSISKDTIDKVLLASGSPQMKAFNDAAAVAKETQARIDVQNAIRAQHGQGPIDEGPGTVMDTYRKAAVAASSAVADALQAAGMKGQALQIILDGLNKTLKEIGANAPKNTGADMFGNIVSGMRTGADAANLFGGPRGAQWGNILNTGANAASNVKAAKDAGPISMANIIPDAQAALSILSLGKSILGLGGQSHDAARAINEAAASVKNMLAALDASVNHDALGGALDAAKAADDARRSQINSDLPGTKNEKTRNAALTKDALDYAQIVAQVKAQFAVTQADFTDSTTAARDRAMGLDYQASALELQVQQRDALQQLQTQGLLLLNGGGTAQQAQNFLDEQALFAAQKTALNTQSLTQVSNAPSGWYGAENYASSFVTRQAAPTSSNTTVTGNTISINLPASADPVATAKAVVAAIRTLGRASGGGINDPVAASMELI